MHQLISKVSGTLIWGCLANSTYSLIGFNLLCTPMCGFWDNACSSGVFATVKDLTNVTKIYLIRSGATGLFLCIRLAYAEGEELVKMGCCDRLLERYEILFDSSIDLGKVSHIHDNQRSSVCFNNVYPWQLKNKGVPSHWIDGYNSKWYFERYCSSPCYPHFPQNLHAFDH